MASYKTDDILKSYINKIVCIYAKNEKSIPLWKVQRDKHIYKGTLTNENLREILHEEIIIEFDSVIKDEDITPEILANIQNESKIVINKIKDKLITQNIFFRITYHNNGKSPHIRFIIQGLEDYDKKYSRIYKQRFVEKLLKEIEFESDFIMLDNSLITSVSKLVSIENQKHFKTKYDGAIEEIIFENKSGDYPKVNVSEMVDIIKQIEHSEKIDKNIIIEKITKKDIDIESLKLLWKKYYTSGRRNSLINAFGGICVRKGLSIDDASDVLIILLDYIGESNSFNSRLNELRYSFKDDKDIAVWYYIRERCNLSLEEAQIFYREFVNCFGDENKEEIQIPGKYRLISEFINDLLNLLKDKNEIFYKYHENKIVKVENDEFVEINASEFITYIEKYVVPGTNSDDGFIKKSITKDVANTVLNSDRFKKALPKIRKIYHTPLPILNENILTFPKKGYDSRFESWTTTKSLNITEIDFEEAKNNILFIFREFCFKNPQDKTNAIAALLTPALRGLYIRPTCRTPAFLYLANRPRCGKDFCAGITGILYEGQATEESAISNEDNKKSSQTDELRKKLTGCMSQGKIRFHSSNNKGHLSNSILEGFLTNEYFSDRLLGKNQIIEFPNEMEISLSANIGLTYSEDLDRRSIKINLFFSQEDANSRVFETPDLWGYILENREKYISSIYSIIKNWYDKGMKPGLTPFTSFNEWAKICGGVMSNAGFGDPCVSNTNELDIGGDNETNDFKILFELCYNDFKCKKFLSSTMRKKAEKYSESYDIFKFLDFESKKGQTIFGINMKLYVGRTLSDIELRKVSTETRASLTEYVLLKEGDILINDLYRDVDII